MNSATNNNLADQWLALTKYLQQAFSRDVDLSELADKVLRTTKENGPSSLLANAVGNAFDKNNVHIDFKELEGQSFSEPLLAWDAVDRPFLIVGRTSKQNFQIVEFSDDGSTKEFSLEPKQLQARFAGGNTFSDRIALSAWDRNTDEDISKRWFWDSIKPLVGVSKFLIIAAVFGNILAVCVSLFALQVWDRVIPANSLNSLAVLLIGVTIAIIFELVLRLQRAALIDEVGAEVDRSISGAVFAQMLSLQSDARPQSMGSLAAQLREINQIREAFSSSMLSAAIDLPFVTIFLAVIFFIGPSLVLPIVGAIAVVVIICLIAQIPLARLAEEGLEESSIRNGLIVETVMKAEDMKLQQAESTMQMRWNHVVETANIVSNKQRRWRNFLSNMTQSTQQCAYIMVVSYGALLVIDGSMTMGQVIACSILTNRTIAPLAQVSAVMGALQGSVIAKRSIDELMLRDNDIPTEKHLRRTLETPAYSFKNVRYSYPETEHGALILPKLDIPHGSKVAVLGRVGSGKSTLLKILSGLIHPSQGTITFDNAEIGSIHRDDLRKAIGFQSQAAALVRGTARDNLLIAKPSATEKEMLKACEISGAANLVTTNPKGLDLMINEAGEGLSGGQRQALLLARTILRNPAVALFDEPTANMDQQSELAFINALKTWGADKTLILATHRMPPLELCDRIIVVNDGRILMDGNKQDVLAELRANGASGANGVNGANGANGASGASGASGVTGEVGVAGVAGANDASGVSALKSVNG